MDRPSAPVQDLNISLLFSTFAGLIKQLLCPSCTSSCIRLYSRKANALSEEDNVWNLHVKCSNCDQSITNKGEPFKFNLLNICNQSESNLTCNDSPKEESDESKANSDIEITNLNKPNTEEEKPAGKIKKILRRSRSINVEKESISPNKKSPTKTNTKDQFPAIKLSNRNRRLSKETSDDIQNKNASPINTNSSKSSSPTKSQTGKSPNKTISADSPKTPIEANNNELKTNKNKRSRSFSPSPKSNSKSKKVSLFKDSNSSNDFEGFQTTDYADYILKLKDLMETMPPEDLQDNAESTEGTDDDSSKEIKVKKNPPKIDHVKQRTIKDVVESMNAPSKDTDGESQGSTEVDESQFEEDEYFVEKILGLRSVNHKKEFYIKWKGYPFSQCSWEPENNLYCKDLVVEFLKKIPLKTQKMEKMMMIQKEWLPVLINDSADTKNKKGSFACSMNNCFSYRKSSEDFNMIRFHKFPFHKPDILTKWVDATERINFNPTDKSFVCNKHFNINDYLFSSTDKTLHLKSVAIPAKITESSKKKKDKPLVDPSSIADILTPEIKLETSDEAMAIDEEGNVCGMTDLQSLFNDTDEDEVFEGFEHISNPTTALPPRINNEPLPSYIQHQQSLHNSRNNKLKKIQPKGRKSNASQSVPTPRVLHQAANGVYILPQNNANMNLGGLVRSQMNKGAIVPSQMVAQSNPSPIPVNSSNMMQNIRHSMNSINSLLENNQMASTTPQMVTMPQTNQLIVRGVVPFNNTDLNLKSIFNQNLQSGNKKIVYIPQNVLQNSMGQVNTRPMMLLNSNSTNLNINNQGTNIPLQQFVNQPMTVIPTQIQDTNISSSSQPLWHQPQSNNQSSPSSRPQPNSSPSEPHNGTSPLHTQTDAGPPITTNGNSGAKAKGKISLVPKTRLMTNTDNTTSDIIECQPTPPRSKEAAEASQLKNQLMYSCNKCSFKSLFMEEISEHCKKHPSNGERYTCEFCDFKTSDNLQIVSHSLWNHRNSDKDEVSRCYYCYFAARTRTNLFRHIERMHDNLDHLVFLCPFCISVCRDENSLKFHLKRFHSKSVNHSCTWCKFIAPDEDIIQFHVARRHENVNTAPSRVKPRFIDNWSDLDADEQPIIEEETTSMTSSIHRKDTPSRRKSMTSETDIATANGENSQSNEEFETTQEGEQEPDASSDVDEDRESPRIMNAFLSQHVLNGNDDSDADY